MKKVIYQSCQEYHLELASVMEEYGWMPVYCLTNRVTNEQVKDKFPDVVCHDQYDAIKGIPPKEYADLELLPLCPEILKKMGSYERSALRMLDRNDSHVHNFLHVERVRFYKKIVAYWITVLSKLKPDIVVFQEEPHQFYDYVLYGVCKVLNIRTVMFIRTMLEERMFAVNSFEEGSQAINEHYQKELRAGNEKDLELPKILHDYLSTIRGNYEDVISLHLWDQIDEVKLLASSRNNFFIRVKKFFQTVQSKFTFSSMLIRYRFVFTKGKGRFDSDQKQKNRSLTNSKFTYFEYLYYMSRALIKKKLNKNFYKSISTENLDLDCKYVFCALHYQPEKTTSPLGGEFDDQEYMIKLISQLVPKGWLVYVKEHPSQFVSSYARYGEKRNRGYYRSILKCPNVRFVSLTSDTFSLIDNSMAVATVTGTVGWESVIRDKPALTFGHAWFKNCEGVFHIASVDDLTRALSKISEGYTVDFNQVRLFAKVVFDNSVNAFIGGLTKSQRISHLQNGQRHADAVKKLEAFNSHIQGRLN
jgi:hypothetical protein